jgi:hypothetical protein
MTSWFDGVANFTTQSYPSYCLLDEVTYTLTTLNTNSNSRINDTFGKSFVLRYMMNLIGEVHSPLNNINRYSTSHPSGDDNGRLHKMTFTSPNSGLTAVSSNLHDAWGNAFGAFGNLTYPLTKLTEVQKFAADIMKAYPRSFFVNELKDVSKLSWSTASYTIAKEQAYILKEGT